MPARAIWHPIPISHAWNPGATGTHIGRRATMIMLHPEVRSHRRQSVIARRVAMYDVLLIAEECFRWSIHVLCLNDIIVWKYVYDIVTNDYICKLCPCVARVIKLTDIKVKTSDGILVLSSGVAVIW